MISPCCIWNTYSLFCTAEEERVWFGLGLFGFNDGNNEAGGGFILKKDLDECLKFKDISQVSRFDFSFGVGVIHSSADVVHLPHPFIIKFALEIGLNAAMEGRGIGCHFPQAALGW